MGAKAAHIMLMKLTPDSTVIDVSRAKLPEELFGSERLEVVDEELPELEDVIPGEVLATFDDYDLKGNKFKNNVPKSYNIFQIRRKA